MKNLKQIFKLNILLTITFSFAINVFAINNDVFAPKKNTTVDYSIIENDLSKKLKIDLAENNLKIKFGDVEETRISNNLVEIKGQAFCVLPSENTQLPINFEAKINPVQRIVADVQYKFVESGYAPSAEEEILMRELMKQVSRDYKTEHITISIDSFEIINAANSQKELKGIGEIKIGEVEWNKLNFDVVLNADKKATKITYDIK